MNVPILSFRLRIAILSSAISGLVLVGFGLVAWVWLNHERLASLDREIRALAYRHPGWMSNRSNYERLGSAIEFIFGEDRKSQLVLLVLGADGVARFQSTHWPPEIDPASLDLELLDDPAVESGVGTVSASTGPSASNDEPLDEPGPHPGGGAGWGGGGRRLGPGPGGGGGRGVGDPAASGMFTKIPRFFTVRTSTRGWRLGILGNARERLVVGLDCSEMNAELGRLRTGFLLALPLALALIGLGGWLVAGQALRPLRSIARAAEQMTARGLDQRIPVSREDSEIDRLITVLNRMMDRLQASFRQATRFSADASHELKTPLAVMQGELEGALQSAENGSQQQRVYASLLDETQRLKLITRSLLLLAQADSGHLPLCPETVALSDELELLAADARILAEAAELEWTSRISPGVVACVDRALLRSAVSNLVDNAIHYNQPGGRVELTLEATADRLILRVSNTGPGIPPEERPHVFDRFHRGNEARSRRREGMGLGLSLAREIVLAHQGELILAESGSGLTVFRLTLPLARPVQKHGQRG